MLSDAILKPTSVVECNHAGELDALVNLKSVRVDSRCFEPFKFSPLRLGEGLGVR